ncbi:uncharacterized protein LOC106876216 [Octopus bimaculoides]|uniref:Vitellogenin domain-containing protein n=1 Tax=Octopus bimaculoides TaxID=37653 RepID=A0A0L8IBH6_OCTBM|nr:uncharacterized protein LOC106876216 [Octopus bimaculoides]|eukprot:XP_014780170.1 PREDICTED: uncharacterized protein LOC106876216 [Octopus bimaculoides]
MDSKLLLCLALSVLLYNIGQVSASCAPCKNSWFKPGSKYIYEYTTEASANFIGIEAVPAGGQLTCNVLVFTPCKCHENIKVAMTGCSMTLVDSNGRDKETKTAYKDLLKKFHVEFSLEEGLVKNGEIYSHKEEKSIALNIKRGVVRMLQLKVGKPENYNNTFNQWDIYGSCQVNYEFSTKKKWTIHTDLDITNCDLHSYFKYQFVPRSHIKTLSGGFHVTNLTELQYPFQSKFSCDYKLNANDHIESVSCLQRQDFEVLKHYGNVEATAMFNVSQSLVLKKIAKGKSSLKLPRDSIRKTTLPFEFEADKTENPSSVSEIVEGLDKIAEAYENDKLNTMSGHFFNLIKMTRSADQKALEKVFSKFRNCPRSDDQCQLGIAALKEIIYMDVLSNCGEKKCIKAVVKNLAKLTDWKKNTFLLNLNLYSDVDEEILNDLLNVCKKEKLNACTTLTNLVVTYAKTANPHEIKQPNNPVYDTLDFYYQLLNKFGHSDKDEINTIWILKGLETLGPLVPNVYRKIIPDVIKCAESTHHSLAMRKSAIRALKAMDCDPTIEAAMKNLLKDNYDSVSIRTEAFIVLDKCEKKDITKFLVGWIQKERIQEMKIFMQTYVKGILQSEDKKLEKRQQIWKDEMKDANFNFQEYLSMEGSKYISYSKTFTLPMLQYPFGGQLDASVVYDPESLMPRNVIISTKGHYGQNNLEIIEINFELEGMEKFVQNIYMTKGMPIWKRLWMFWSKLTETGKDQKQTKDFKFSLPDDDIVDELIKLLDVANFPEEFIPKGYVHVNMYGYNIFMWDVITFLKNIPNLKKSFTEELKTEKLLLGQFTELYRAIPTAFGVPYNMTLLISNIYHTSNKVTKPYSRSLKFRMAVNFHARIALDLPDEIPEGLEMQTEMQVYLGVSGQNKVAYNEKSGAAEHIKWTIEVDRTDKDVVLLNIKHRLYLVRGDLVHVSADKSSKINKQRLSWCFTPLVSILFRVKACFQLSKPDVLTSHDHAYTPLNGDIDVSLTLKPMDKKIEKVQMEIEKEVTSSSKPESILSIKTAVLSDSSTYDKVSINVRKSLDGDKLSVTTRFPDMQDISFNLELNKHRTKQIHKVNFDMTLTVLRIKEILGIHFKGINSNNKMFANLRLSLLEAISETTFEFSEVNAKTVWLFNTKYHCPPTYPILYQLHIDPVKAGKENDVTHVKFLMERIRKKTNNKWMADRKLKFHYPGHDYTYLSHMDEVNNKGKLTGNVTWDHDWGQEYLEMTGDMVITTPSPDTKVQLFKMVYRHRKDDTALAVKFKKVTSPLKFLANYEIDYNKRPSRKRRSTKKLLKKLADLAKRISAGDFQETPKPEIRTRPPSTSQPSPSPTFSPGPHHDIFYKAYNFLKNGPENWINRVSVQFETIPQVNPRSKTIYSIEHKIKVDVNYPQWHGQEKIKVDAAFGAAQILDGEKKWAEISFKGNRLPKNTDMTFHLIEKTNYLNYSHELKSTKVANKFSFEKVDDSEFNLVHKLEVPFLQQNFDIQFKMSHEDHEKYLKVMSKITSDQWKKLAHEYYSDQTWSGYFMLTPEYGLNRTSSFIHQYVNYTSKWDLICNKEKVYMYLQAYVEGKHPAIISMDGLVVIEEAKNTDLPKISVKLLLPDVMLRFAGRVTDEKNLILEIKKDGSGRNVPVADWTMSLSKPSEISQDIVIKPNAIGPLRKWMQQKQALFSSVLNPFVAAVDSNPEKPYSEITIPYYGQTVGELLNNVFYSSVRTVMPIFDIIPLSSRPMSEVFYERILKMSQNFKTKFKNSIFDREKVKSLKYGIGAVAKAVGNYIQERVTNYPRLFNLYMERAVKARLVPMLAQGKIHFTLFHPFIWESFKTSPKLTTPLYLFMHKLQTHDFFPFLRRYTTHVAVLSDDKVVTFDGYLYNLPPAFGNNKCTHLLAADVAHKTFAILKETDGVTLSCSRTSLKVFNNCSISVDGDGSFIELPYQCPMKMTSAKMWGPYVVVTSVYGVEIMCSPNEMKIIFDGIHHNHTLGLLGNADGDFGTDMKLTDGTLASNIAQFINHYELSKRQKCQISKKDVTQTYPKHCPAETKQKCLETFALYLSPLNNCFDENNPMNYLDHCIKSCADNDKKSGLCSLVSTYVSQCQPKKDIDLPKTCIKCTQSREQIIWKEKTRKVKRDVVLILDEHKLIAKEPAHNYVYSLFEQVQVKDARLGLVAYGGTYGGTTEHANVYTIEGQYFGTEDNIHLALKNLKKSSQGKRGVDHDGHGHQSHGHHDKHFHKGHKSPLYTPHNSHHFGHQLSPLHEALLWAADYPFKKDSGRMIMIFADITTLQNTTDLSHIVSMLAKRDIVVNIFTDTSKIMNKKYYGLTHQGKVFHKAKKNIEIKIPTDEFFKLIFLTRGNLYNAKLILSQNSGFIRVINDQLEAQMSEKRCRNCKCIYSKEKRKSVVYCVADDLSSKC